MWSIPWNLGTRDYEDSTEPTEYLLIFSCCKWGNEAWGGRKKSTHLINVGNRIQTQIIPILTHARKERFKTEHWEPSHNIKPLHLGSADAVSFYSPLLSLEINGSSFYFGMKWFLYSECWYMWLFLYLWNISQVSNRKGLLVELNHQKLYLSLL